MLRGSRLSAALSLAAALLAEPGFAALDRIVAVVNDNVILESALQAEVARITRDLAQRGTKPPPRDTLEKQVLDYLVAEELQLQIASQSGIRVEDEELNFTLQNIAEKNGLTIDDMRHSIEQEGLSFSQFREQIRREMIITRLQRRDVVQRINVSDREIENFLAAQAKGGDDGRVRLAHILIPIPEGPTQKQIDAARRKVDTLAEQIARGADFAGLAVANSGGQNALQGGDLGWRTAAELPAIFAAAIQNVPTGGVSGVVQSQSGFHLLKVAERQGSEQRIVEQRHLRHILIKVKEGASAEELEEARIRLSQLRQRILAGDDLAALAQAHSDDPGSAIKGGDLGWIGPGEMVARFEQAATTLPLNGLSEPVRTEFGWHLIQVLGVRNIDDTAQHRRQRAVDQIRARKADERIGNWQRRLRDEAYVEYRL